jgi:large subunit ribosomal protein L2
MAVKKYRPITSSRRFASVLTYDEITRDKPEKSEVTTLRVRRGRSSAGRVTMRHRGGGNKKKYRKVDFKRDKFDVPAKVASIEYDPSRSANIALVVYADGEKRYILAPQGLNVGNTVKAGSKCDLAVGNAMPLSGIALGTAVHNIEINPGSGGKLVRGAGLAAILVSSEGRYVTLRMPSGETRQLHHQCMATVGRVGNADYENVSLGKAGRARWLGRRPHVRGCAMNPVDHPMGGGEGRASGGHPQSPWNQPSKGFKTRKKNKYSNRLIISRRKK